MAENSLYVGLDVGGTNTVIGLVDAQGNFLKQKTIPTHANATVDVFLEHVDDVIRKLTNSKRNALAGIGIGAPSVNYKLGYLDNPKNFNWGKVNLTQVFADKFKVPVRMINDADAAALGELHFGIARDLTDFVHITLGTGLGSSIVANKQLVMGQYGFAGELGHTKVCAGDRLCSCGKRGCLETYVSASGICRTAFELISNGRINTPLKNYSFNELTPKIITEFAKEGDALAIETYRYTGKILGEKLADVVALLNPEAIIFSGGLTGAGEFLFGPMKQALEENLLPMLKGSVEVRISDSNKNYAVLGAVALLLQGH